ncbi:YHS domain-containing (seleno)protein [Methylobacterium frigidaeris]|uniref:Uncharacterized protein n=1 Tax=Methylobacterium frigidaeris TaxID=2038277 RepID=A0AA37H6U4_9HYPH|nr:YHS domain-containing (seleno)protein [Methylobacterium frigidaeris]PIK68475.1 hypothetical protein CS379_34710 [Methylobacterium frigidaeris]GJD59955.1 hypothetical protein MPEAHAMD_0086 [Methylobacterium frigidaeris]
MGKIRLTRRGVLSLLPLAAVGPARGETPLGVPGLYAADPLTALALRGFDPVSYRLGSTPQAGVEAHEFAWSGLVWRFASAANRGAFARAPEAYAPRLGGLDPEGVAAGRLVEADPLVAALRDDRLYLFRDAERRARADTTLIDAAEARWPILRPDAAIGG